MRKVEIVLGAIVLLGMWSYMLSTTVENSTKERLAMDMMIACANAGGKERACDMTYEVAGNYAHIEVGGVRVFCRKADSDPC